MTTTSDSDSFPRQAARTRHFRLGAPRQISISPDGSRILFVRSRAGDDAVNQLVTAHLDGSRIVERVVVDPIALLGGSDEDLPAAERARRERMRETTSGVTTYSTDSADTRATFALSGRLFVVDLLTAGAEASELPAQEPVIDPRMSPDGQWIAYVHDRELRVIGTDGRGDRAVASPDSPTVTCGLADFIAAEEHDRARGHWWSPDSTALLVERFDDALVAQWWISDPATPGAEPVQHRYPAAGTTNAEVSLYLVKLDGEPLQVEWDASEFPYLISVSWSGYGPALITVMSRDQCRSQTLTLDPSTATAELLHSDSDPHWLDVIVGLPTWMPDGRLARAVDDHDTDTRRLAIGDDLVTPPGVQLISASGCDDDGLIVTMADEPHLRTPWLVSTDGACQPLTSEQGIHAAMRGGDTIVLASQTLDTVATTWTIMRDGQPIGTLDSFAQRPSLTPRVHLMRAGERGLLTAVLLPTHRTSTGPLPVVMAPYGGPHHNEVLAAGLAFAQAQWIADQGFAVVVADGRGTEARGPAWERAVYRDFAGPVLEDQIDALHAAAAEFPDDLDLSRVGMVGWSFGGWLSALAVLARPDVFHAGVAGAPPTDWHLYDTAYTERYLGHPDDDPAAYERNSLIPLAAGLRRPLMLIHGLADDNVVAANTLALSSALLAAGRPHTVLPLSGVTHLATQEDVAEGLLRLQVDFLRDALATPSA